MPLVIAFLKRGVYEDLPVAYNMDYDVRGEGTGCFIDIRKKIL